MLTAFDIGPDYWAPPPGWSHPDGYPREHPAVCPDDALEVLPAGLDDDDEALWRAWRLTGIGASDVSGLLGLHEPYTGPMQVFMEKRGLMEVWDPDHPGSSAAEYGTAFEGIVRDKYAARHELTILKPGTFRSCRWPWLVVNPDGLVIGRREGYEGKTASVFYADQWDDDQVPDHAELQCQTVMAVLGLDGMHVCCLIGGQRHVDRYVSRDDALIADIVEITDEFWHQRVLADTPPPPDGGVACEAFLTKRHLVAAIGPNAECPDDVATYVRAAHAQQSAAQTYVVGSRQGKNVARERLGDCTELLTGDGDLVATWRPTGALRTDELLAEHPDETGPFMVKREVLDTAAFAAAHPELYTRYRTRTLLIKPYKDPTTTKRKRRSDHDG